MNVICQQLSSRSEDKLKVVIEDIYVEFRKPGYREKATILNGITIEVHAGEVVSVLGKSGCGKTTLLNVIAGLLSPTKGRIYMVNGEGKKPRIGYVFQRFSLFPWMNVKENVEIGLPPGKKDEESVERVLELVGLSEYSSQKATNLSGGMAQRVALARALVSKPDVMLLDEPFSALDAFTKLRLQEEVISILKKENITSILVTHDIDEAIFFGERILVMSDEGTIKSRLKVDLPHVRDRNSPGFFEVREKIYREFGLSAPKPFFYQI